MSSLRCETGNAWNVICRCLGCGRAAVDFIKSRDASSSDFYRLFAPLHSQAIMFEIVVIPRECTQVELKDYGLPEAALITAITYWAVDGFLNPVEVTGWVHSRSFASRADDGTFGVPPGLSRSLKRLDLPRQLKILGAEIGPGEVGPTTVGVAVDWLEPDVSEIASEPIFWALEAFGAGRLHAAVMLAQVAAEIKADELFKSKDMSYYTQLEKLRKKAHDSRAAKWNPNPGHIYDLMDEMRRRRNAFAHEGKWNPELERSIVAEFLCATVFMVHHLNMLRTTGEMFGVREST